MNSFTNNAAASSNDRILAASLAILSTFILGYSATRVILNLATASSSQAQAESVIPHQSAGWAPLGEHSFQ